MTYREKDPKASPDLLTSNQFENDIIKSISAAKGNYSENRYGHKKIREALKLIYGKKCAYCESNIEPCSPKNVDHYRPLNSYSKSPNPQHHTGYYWLGYEWTNLIQSCGSCNMAKLSKFHLHAPANRKVNPPPLLGLIPDYDSHKVGSSFFANEDPLLINPEITDPDTHLFVNHFGLLEPKNLSIYGLATIEICDLNRDGLYVERAALIDSFIIDFEREIYNRYKEDESASTDIQYKERLFEIFKRILSQTHFELEYNMTARSIIERFDDLILDSIDRPFRKQVRVFFVEFLRNQ